MSPDQLGDLMKLWAQAVGGLDRESAQALLESKSNFAYGLPLYVEKHACYPDEEKETDLTYPEDYAGPASIRWQIETLAERFGLDSQGAIQAMEVAGDKHKLAEGWFAAPDWEAVHSDYGEACLLVTEWIRENSVWNKEGPGPEQTLFGHCVLGSDYHDLEWVFTERYLEWRWHMKMCHPKVGKAYRDSPVWIFPAQFGRLHAGRSHRRTNMLCRQTKGEHPLGLFEVLCMVALHLERLGKNPEERFAKHTSLGVLAPGVTAEKGGTTGELDKHGGWESGGTAYHQRRYFELTAEASSRVKGGYGRVVSLLSSDSHPNLERAGPVTAWTWQKKDRTN